MEVNEPKKRANERPKYLDGMIAKWTQWTGIEGEDVDEALTDLTGNLWKEMRKLQSMTCKQMELAGVDDDIKESFKSNLGDTWRLIVNNQKVGLDKLGILVRREIENAKE